MPNQRLDEARALPVTFRRVAEIISHRIFFSRQSRAVEDGATSLKSLRASLSYLVPPNSSDPIGMRSGRACTPRLLVSVLRLSRDCPTSYQ